MFGLEEGNRMSTEPLPYSYEKPPEGPIYDRDSFHEKFDTEAYLKDFYEKVEEPAMRLVLNYLPAIAARLPENVSVLDVGAGPTMHVALCFRHKADFVVLSDYLEQNRKELIRWVRKDSKFDWSKTISLVACQEGITSDKWRFMEDQARKKVRSILPCDIFSPNVIPQFNDGQKFDVVTCILCIEYACKTIEEYMGAVRNICSLVDIGGHVIIGGVLEETWCAFGGNTFTCLYITENDLRQALIGGGVDGSEESLCFYYIEGMYLACGKKVAQCQPIRVDTSL